MPLSQQSLDFLFENRLHDSREWFFDHQKEYRTLVKQPMEALSAALGPRLLAIDPELAIEPVVGKTISRIRRDTRFTKDKSLYRDNLWIVYRRKEAGGYPPPCLYFEVYSDGRFRYGCGYYYTAPVYMEMLRRRVLAGAPVWRDAQRALEMAQGFALMGERYKRPHYPDADPVQRDWLELREISVSAGDHDAGLLFSDRLAAAVADRLLEIAPVYTFLLETAKATPAPAHRR